MITEPLKRGSVCYWNQGGSFTQIKFLSLHDMPTLPRAVKAIHNGSEVILKDFEVLTAPEKFCEQNKRIIKLLKLGPSGRGLNRKVAEELEEPYSKVLRVAKECRELGVEICQKRKDDTKTSTKSLP